MRNPFFSIIIPCYNARAYIACTLDTFERQTFRNFEVICIDDCSTDDTYTYLLKRAEESTVTIQVYKNESNKGPGQSRNVAIAYAKGEYVVFCDSDDWLEENALEILRRKLVLNNGNTDVLIFNYYTVFDSGKKVPRDITSILRGCQKKEDLVALAPSSLCCMVIKRELLFRVPIADLYNAEDMVTVPILLSVAEHVECINDNLYNYFYRPTSLSKTLNPSVVENFKLAYEYLKANIGGNYRTAFEFHGINLIVYGLIYNAIRCKLGIGEIKKGIKVFEDDFPQWYRNRYIKYLPFRKRCWCYFVRNHFFLALYLYFEAQLLYFKLHSFSK